MKAVNYLGYQLVSGVGGGGGGGGSFSAGISGGNTAGDTGTVSNRIVFAGGNNVTVSGSTNAGGMTVTISGGAAGGGVITHFATGNTTQSSSGTMSVNSVIFRGEGAVSVGITNGSIVVSAPNTIAQSNQTGGIYFVGNTTGQSSSSTHDARTLSMNGAGIVSMGWSNGSVYVSATVPAQTNQTVGFYGLQNTTAQSSSSTWDARSMSFAGLGIVSVGNSAGSGLVISATQSNQAFSAGAAQSNFQTLVFQDSNGISFSNNAGSVRVTHDLQFTSNTSNITSNALHTSASRVFNIVAATNNTGGGTASLSSNVSFSAANGLTFYTSAGNAIVGSYTVPTQTNQTGGIYVTAQSTGQSSSSTYDLRTLSIIPDGIISAGWSAGSFRISATQSNQAFSAAGGASNFQTLSFSDNGFVSWTNNAGQVAVTQLRGSFFATNNTTQSSSGTINLNSVIFRGEGIASVGVSNGSIVVSVPAGGGAGDGGNVVGVSTGGHTAGNTGTTSTGTIIFEGSNSLTLSFITGGAGIHTLRFIPAMSQLTAGDNISLSTAGSTVSIINLGAGTGFTSGTTQGSVPSATLSTNGLSFLMPIVIVSDFEPEVRGQTTSNSIAMGTGYIQNFMVYDNLSLYRVQMMHQITTQPTSSQSYSASVSGGAGSTGATGRVGSTATMWFMSRQSTGTNANSSNLVSFYSNSFSQQLDMFATWSNSTNASSATLRLTTSAVLTFVSSIGSNSWTTGTVTTSGSTSFTSTSTNGQTFSSSFGHSFASLMLSGVRPVLVPMHTSLSPGKYWLAQNWSTSSGSTNLSLQRVLNVTFGLVCFTTNTQGFLRIGATNTTANTNLTQGWGSHSATSQFTTTFPITNVSNMSQYQTWFNMQALVS